MRLSTTMAKKKKAPAKEAAQRESDRALEHIVRHVHNPKNRGAITALTQEMSRVGKTPFHRQLVELWLHPDPEVRTQPLYGAGLLLQRAFSRLKKKAALN